MLYGRKTNVGHLKYIRTRFWSVYKAGMGPRSIWYFLLEGIPVRLSVLFSIDLHCVTSGTLDVSDWKMQANRV